MTWTAYGEFLLLALLLTLVPGPDFAVVTKNTLVGGRRRGRWTVFGVTCSNATQGTAAALGLGALITRAQPVFEALKWAGVVYLVFLGTQALRSALAGRYLTDRPDRAVPGAAVSGWRQGYLTNITNPKVLVFYLAVLPQFLSHGAAPAWLWVFALSHALLGLLYLLLLTAGIHRARRFLARRRVRRALDAATGAALLGFGVRLAADRA